MTLFNKRYVQPIHYLKPLTIPLIFLCIFTSALIGCSAPEVPEPKVQNTDTPTNSSSLKKTSRDQSLNQTTSTNIAKVANKPKAVNKAKAHDQKSTPNKSKNINNTKVKLDLRLDEQTLSSIQQNTFNRNCGNNEKDCLWIDKKAPLPELFSQKDKDNRFSISGDIERDGEKELLDIKAIKGGEVSIEYKFK